MCGRRNFLIRKETVADSKISGRYVWTESQLSVINNIIIINPIQTLKTEKNVLRMKYILPVAGCTMQDHYNSNQKDMTKKNTKGYTTHQLFYEM